MTISKNIILIHCLIIVYSQTFLLELNMNEAEKKLHKRRIQIRSAAMDNKQIDHGKHMRWLRE